MFNSKYVEQVRLLVSTLPFASDERCFALKGGTAINLFVRDMPRLSVDIDLFYLPVGPRDEALSEIDAALRRIADAVQASLPGTEIDIAEDRLVTNFNVRQGRSVVKVESSPVTRGCLYPQETMRIRPVVEETFGYADIPVVSFADLYAGKLCAALDRQHPRDLYDVMLLLDNEGLSEELMEALIVYIACNKEPMNELIAPRWKDIGDSYTNHFVGMTLKPVPLEALHNTAKRLLDEIARHIEPRHAEFLLSLKRNAPDWDLLRVPIVSKLPAVQWKLLNIGKMTTDKRDAAVKKLEEALSSLLERKQRLAHEDDNGDWGEKVAVPSPSKAGLFR